MARSTAAAASSREHQTTLFERLDALAKRAEETDPTPAAIGIFCTVLGLMGIGFLMQVSHAATTSSPSALNEAIREHALFRVGGIALMLLAFKVGPIRLRPLVPVITAIAGILLVCCFLPVIGANLNGASRWINVPFARGMTIQPSELARIAIVLWIADRCTRLGGDVRNMRTGVVPMLALGLSFFFLILIETDLGGALLFLLCLCCTMWVGGARPVHVAGSIVGLGGGALLFAFSSLGYVRSRVEMWLGNMKNDQVERSLAAMSSGDWFGQGVALGAHRNEGVPYLESDYVFALIGEELGLFGMVFVLALLLAFVWYSMRITLAIRNRYCALVAFGLLIAVGCQAMLHVQVATGLAPPKGMPLPFISDGGTSLLAACLAVGLALGAARDSKREFDLEVAG